VNIPKGLPPEEFFSGVDCSIFINGVFLSDAVTLSYVVANSAAPIHQTTLSIYKFITRGKKFISGTLNFPFVGPSTLQNITKNNSTSTSPITTSSLLALQSKARMEDNKPYANLLALHRAYVNSGGTTKGQFPQNMTMAKEMVILMGNNDITDTDYRIEIVFTNVYFTDMGIQLDSSGVPIEVTAQFIAQKIKENEY